MNDERIITKNNLIIGFFWKLLERLGVQFIQFFIQLLLARILFPEDYGTISLISIFIAIANVFVESGFNIALIQKNKVDDLDYSTAYIISFIMSIILYIVLWILAPYIAKFYDLMLLTNLIRILSLSLIIGSLNSIQIAYVTKNYLFKTLFSCSLFSVIISGIIGVFFAFKGFGAWSLVAQQLVQKIIVTILLLFKIKWKPKLRFSSEKAREMFGFGSRLMISNLINTIYVNIYGLIIGKMYDKRMLGFYNRAEQFPNIIMNNINGSMQSVILPAMAQEQENKLKLKSLMKRTLKVSTFVSFPIMIGLCVCAKQIVIILLTEKWLKCVPFLQILCLSYSFYPIHTVNLQAINAIGRSDIFLKLEIIKKIVGVIVLCISIPYGIYAMVSLQVVDNMISTFINSRPNKKNLDYGLREQLTDIFPIIFCTIIMGLIVSCVDLILQNTLIVLPTKIIIGIIVYIILALLLKLETFGYILNVISSVFKHKNGTKN